MTHHPDWSALNVLADGLASGRTTSGHTLADQTMRAHLAGCSVCSGTVATLVRLAQEAHALPRAMPVPDNESLWREIEQSVTPARRPQQTGAEQSPFHISQLTSQQTPQLTPQLTSQHIPQRFSWRVMAAAAAIALMSSGTTWWIMRTPAPSPGTTPVALSAIFHDTEVAYLDHVAQLRRDLARVRDELDPRTVAAVERSLEVIDAAIVEAREALLADPANALVSELLASHYRQKIELLRRATQLTPAV